MIKSNPVFIISSIQVNPPLFSSCLPPIREPATRPPYPVTLIVWVDEQLPPRIAPWMTEVFGIKVIPVREIHLQGAIDSEIFMSAREHNAVIMTKDTDFTYLLQGNGPPTDYLDHMRKYVEHSLKGHIDRGLAIGDRPS